MSIKTRRFLFYVLLGVFLTASPLILAYANGWRVNAKTWQIQRVGGIFLRGYPDDAKITLNGREIKKSGQGLFQTGTLIANLLPGKYFVRIEEAGGKIWQKQLSVLSSLVSESKSILIPKTEETAEKIFSGPIKDFRMENDKILWTSAKREIFYSYPENHSSSSDTTAKIIGNELVNESFDHKTLITSKNGLYFATSLDSPESSLGINALLRELGDSSEILEALPHPYDDSQWIIRTKKWFGILDAPDGTLTAIEDAADAKITYAVAVKNEIIFSENNASGSASSLWSYNLPLRNKKMLIENLPSRINDLEQIGSSMGMLFANGDLYVSNDPATEMKKIESSVKRFWPSPDGRKILAETQSGLFVYRMDASGDEIQKAKGVFQVAGSNEFQSIRDIVWHKNSGYVMIQNGGKLIFMEIDDRTPRNTWTLAQNIKTFRYDPERDTVYTLKDGSVWSLALSS